MGVGDLSTQDVKRWVEKFMSCCPGFSVLRFSSFPPSFLFFSLSHEPQLLHAACELQTFELNGTFHRSHCGNAMDDGTLDAGGVAAGGRPGMPLLVPLQRLSSLSSLVVDPNGDLADPRPETRRTRAGTELAGSRLLGGLVRSAAKPESRDFADFGKAVDMGAEAEAEVVKVPDSPEEEEESEEEKEGRNCEVESPVKKRLQEAPMSPLRKMMSDQWNVLSRNLPPLPDLKAMSPLALLLRRGGDVVGEEKVRKGRIQPMASVKGGNKTKKLVNKKSFLASVSRRRNKLLKGIEKDFCSETSRAPKDSRRLTIKKLLKSEVVKLDVVKIKLIATAFKEAGYKSGSSYLAEAKLMHVEEGGDWTQQLDRVFKMSKRALDRGKGPHKKAPEVPVQVRREALTRKKKLSTKVLFPRELFQFGIAWMLREVEIRFFEVRDLVVDWQKKRITLCWRTSKCDQSGEEVRRTLQCLCAGDMCAEASGGSQEEYGNSEDGHRGEDEGFGKGMWNRRGVFAPFGAEPGRESGTRQCCTRSFSTAGHLENSLWMVLWQVQLLLHPRLGGRDLLEMQSRAEHRG